MQSHENSPSPAFTTPISQSTPRPVPDDNAGTPKESTAIKKPVLNAKTLAVITEDVEDDAQKQTDTRSVRSNSTFLLSPHIGSSFSTGHVTPAVPPVLEQSGNAGANNTLDMQISPIVDEGTDCRK